MLCPPWSTGIQQGRMNEACARLVEVGFREELSMIHNVKNKGYSAENFLEFMKVVTDIHDLEDTTEFISDLE